MRVRLKAAKYSSWDSCVSGSTDSVSQYSTLRAQQSSFQLTKSPIITHSRVEWLSLGSFSRNEFLMYSTPPRALLFFQFLNKASIRSWENSVKKVEFKKQATQQGTAITTCNVHFLFKDPFAILIQAPTLLRMRFVQNIEFLVEDLSQFIAPRYPFVRFQMSTGWVPTVRGKAWRKKKKDGRNGKLITLNTDYKPHGLP